MSMAFKGSIRTSLLKSSQFINGNFTVICSGIKPRPNKTDWSKNFTSLVERASIITYDSSSPRSSLFNSGFRSKLKITLEVLTRPSWHLTTRSASQVKALLASLSKKSQRRLMVLLAQVFSTLKPIAALNRTDEHRLHQQRLLWRLLLRVFSKEATHMGCL